MRFEDWFAARGWSPFAFQRDVWDAYRAGESGLIHAATGTGKTLAAWGGPLASGSTSKRSCRGDRAKRPRRSTAPPLRVLWITPLRALAADTHEALARSRSSTSAFRGRSSRARATRPRRCARDRHAACPPRSSRRRRSLSLMLSRDDAREMFADLARGRRRRMARADGNEARRAVGARARASPHATSRVFAPGDSRRRSATWPTPATRCSASVAAKRGRIVRGVEPKDVVIDALIPPVVERFPWAGHLGTQMLPQVVEAIEEGESAIVFTNTRSQTEIWYQAILAARPDWAGSIALHHGSLDRKTRDWVEDGLRAGTLRCVVATSSLDLGVDFSPVDRVLQIGSPKGVARLLQRAGRSGHRPGAISRVTCVPTNALELIEVAAARDGAESGRDRVAAAGRAPARRARAARRDRRARRRLRAGAAAGARCERRARTPSLRDDEWAWVLDFRHARRRRAARVSRVCASRRRGRSITSSTSDEIARRHRMSIGTIVGDAQIVVQYLRGAPLGSVEESFVARLKPGDRFVFAGTPLEFVRVRDMKAWVQRAPNTKGAIPRWMGSRLPLSGELAAMLRARLGEAADGVFRGAELEALRPLLEIQRKWSRIPRADELLIERVKTRDGWHLFVYPFEGRLVHEGLAALFAYRLSRLAPITFSMASND